MMNSLTELVAEGEKLAHAAADSVFTANDNREKLTVWEDRLILPGKRRVRRRNHPIGHYFYPFGSTPGTRPIYLLDNANVASGTHSYTFEEFATVAVPTMIPSASTPPVSRHAEAYWTIGDVQHVLVSLRGLSAKG